MSALEPPHDHAYWTGALSAGIAWSLTEKRPETVLRPLLRRFLEEPGPVPSDELRRMLREDVK